MQKEQLNKRIQPLCNVTALGSACGEVAKVQEEIDHFTCWRDLGLVVSGILALFEFGIFKSILCKNVDEMIFLLGIIFIVTLLGMIGILSTATDFQRDINQRRKTIEHLEIADLVIKKLQEDAKESKVVEDIPVKEESDVIAEESKVVEVEVELISA